MSKRMGRPPLPADVRLSRTVQFRIRQALHDKMRLAAASNGRSMSEEAEARLAASFSTPEVLDKIAETIRAEFSRSRTVEVTGSSYEPSSQADWLDAVNWFSA